MLTSEVSVKNVKNHFPFNKNAASISIKKWQKRVLKEAPSLSLNQFDCQEYSLAAVEGDE